MTALTGSNHPTNAPPTTGAGLSALEAATGLTLPDDGKAAVSAHSGQVTDKQAVPLCCGSTVFEPLLFVFRDKRGVRSPDDARFCLTDIEGRLGSGGQQEGRLIPFSTNTRASCSCLDYRKSDTKPSVVVVDLSHDPGEQWAFFPLAESFMAFLRLPA